MERLIARKPKEEAVVLSHLKNISNIMGYILESVMVISL
jgi:hypothetical protein